MYKLSTQASLRIYIFSYIFCGLGLGLLQCQISDSNMITIKFGFQLQNLNLDQSILGPFAYRSQSVSPLLSLDHQITETEKLSFQYVLNYYESSTVLDNPPTRALFRSGFYQSISLRYHKNFPNILDGRLSGIIGLYVDKRRIEQSSSFISTFPTSGVLISAEYDFGDISIYFNKNIQVRPFFDVFDSYHNSIGFATPVYGNKGSTSNRPFERLRILLSSNVSPTPIETPNDLYNFYSIYLGIGLTYEVNPKIYLSARRRSWKRWTSGILSNQLIGVVNINDFIIGWNAHDRWSLSFGWHPIKNANNPLGRIQITEVDPHTGNIIVGFRTRSINEYGFSLGTSYNFSDSLSMELRNIFLYKGDSILSPRYLSLGFLFHI